MNRLHRGESIARLALVVLLFSILTPLAHGLQRGEVVKPIYNSLADEANTDVIVLKLAEGVERPALRGTQLTASQGVLDGVNTALESDAVALVGPRQRVDPEILDRLRAEATAKSGTRIPDLSLYYEITVAAPATRSERLALVNALNADPMVEIAYFAPVPEIASFQSPDQPTPGWESGQYYLQPAPVGIDAYAGWQLPGGKGDDVMVVDIEGNWIQTHEDLHGGTDDFHIAGSRINDASWWNHGTAVLGEIASDSNSFGMTGIAFNVDLGTVSIGSMSTASALTTATNATEEGDIILIELHAPGPHYDFEPRDDQLGYVAMEYWQENFDAILLASNLGRIVVEAGGNGAENFDDTDIYDLLFDSTFRFSGAIMVAASNSDHEPASFTNYGERLDVHAFGTWDVYTLGYGDLYGSNSDNHYTASFAGTSSASPIIVGACAVLQGIQKAAHGWPLDHTGMRSLLKDYSTPQAPSSKPIGPLPDLAGSSLEVLGVSFVADTTVGWLPLGVDFTASSGLTVDTWTWDFGDGDSAYTQNPTHVFDERGLYDVTLEIEAAGDVRTLMRPSYIAALADSLYGDTVDAASAETLVVYINATNTVPLRDITIPVEYAGTLDLTPVTPYWSTDGCRTSGLDLQEQVHFDPGNKRMSFRLANTGSSIDLPGGTGPILKLFFLIDGAATESQEAEIVVDGYLSYSPEFESSYLTYDPILSSGLVHFADCCQGIRGNVDDDPMQTVDIADLVYLVGYMFSEGPEPPCLAEANIDGDIFGTVDIADLIHLVGYMFQEGPEPAVCY